MDKVLNKAKKKMRDKVQVERMTASSVIKRYIALSEKEKEIEAEKEQIKAWVKANSKLGISVKSADGEFRVIEANKRVWSVGAVKQMFGEGWEEYVQADNSLVGEKAKSMANTDTVRFTNMLKLSTVTTVEQVKLFKS